MFIIFESPDCRLAKKQADIFTSNLTKLNLDFFYGSYYFDYEMITIDDIILSLYEDIIPNLKKNNFIVIDRFYLSCVCKSYIFNQKFTTMDIWLKKAQRFIKKLLAQTNFNKLEYKTFVIRADENNLIDSVNKLSLKRSKRRIIQKFELTKKIDPKIHFIDYSDDQMLIHKKITSQIFINRPFVNR